MKRLLKILRENIVASVIFFAALGGVLIALETSSTLKSLKSVIHSFFTELKVQDVIFILIVVVVIILGVGVYKLYSHLPIKRRENIIQNILREIDDPLKLGKLIKKLEIDNLRLKNHIQDNIIDFYMNWWAGQSFILLSGVPKPPNSHSDGYKVIEIRNIGENVNIDFDTIIYYEQYAIGLNFDLDACVDTHISINEDGGIEHTSSHDYIYRECVSKDEYNVKISGIVSIEVYPEIFNTMDLPLLQDQEIDDHLKDMYTNSSIDIQSIKFIFQWNQLKRTRPENRV